MQHILIVIFFNQRINLNRLDQLCLAHRRTDHGSGRAAVDALNGLKVEDTLTHDYETILLLLYIQFKPFFCHFGFVPFIIRFGAQKMSSILGPFACGDFGWCLGVVHFILLCVNVL